MRGGSGRSLKCQVYTVVSLVELALGPVLDHLSQCYRQHSALYF